MIHSVWLSVYADLLRTLEHLVSDELPISIGVSDFEDYVWNLYVLDNLYVLEEALGWDKHCLDVTGRSL